MAITVYGIKNCDTMKKAFKWLDSQGLDYQFQDYKKAGIDKEHLDSWLRQAPWDELINKRGTTWRKLPESARENIDDEKACVLMMENTSLIKRPVLELDGKIFLGFKPEQYAEIFDI